MKYYILNQRFVSKDIFLQLEDLAFVEAAYKRYILFKVYDSKLMGCKIYLNLN
jgi:hypothetical protein